MKRVIKHKLFIKNYKRRVASNKSLNKQFEQRLALFLNGVRGNPLDDHSLIGQRKGLRSFSVTGDVRVIYRESDEYYEFLDIGTHNQVY